MLSRISRPQGRISGEARLDASTQVYVWPQSFERLSRTAMAAGIVVFIGGFLLMAGRTQQPEELMLLTAGLFLVVGGAAIMVMVALAHACLAREVHFHRLYCIIRQTGRDDLMLPYSTYDDEWVVDFSLPKSMRVIVTAHRRGFTIVSPPEWLRVAFMEIARIQEEEGWSDPE